MKVSIRFINHPDVVRFLISIKIKVINMIVFIIERLFKTLKCLRFLENLQYGIQIQIVAGQI